jgi:hypothetical protein
MRLVDKAIRGPVRSVRSASQVVLCSYLPSPWHSSSSSRQLRGCADSHPGILTNQLVCATLALSQDPGTALGDLRDVNHGSGMVFESEERCLTVVGVNEVDEERKTNSLVYVGGTVRYGGVLPRGDTCTPPYTGSKGQIYTRIFVDFESGRRRYGGERKEEGGLHKGMSSAPPGLGVPVLRPGLGAPTPFSEKGWRFFSLSSSSTPSILHTTRPGASLNHQRTPRAGLVLVSTIETSCVF